MLYDDKDIFYLWNKTSPYLTRQTNWWFLPFYCI